MIVGVRDTALALPSALVLLTYHPSTLVRHAARCGTSPLLTAAALLLLTAIVFAAFLTAASFATAFTTTLTATVPAALLATALLAAALVWFITLASAALILCSISVFHVRSFPTLCLGWSNVVMCPPSFSRMKAQQQSVVSVRPSMCGIAPTLQILRRTVHAMSIPALSGELWDDTEVKKTVRDVLGAPSSWSSSFSSRRKQRDIRGARIVEVFCPANKVNLHIR